MHIQNILTDFRIFETKTHLHILITQEMNEPKLFSKMLEQQIKNFGSFKKKKMVVICKIREKAYLRVIIQILKEVLEGKDVASLKEKYVENM